MRLESIKTIPFYSDVEATLSNPEKKPECGLYFLFQDSSKVNRFLLSGCSNLEEKKVYSIGMKNQQDAVNLADQLRRSRANVCKVKASLESGTVVFDLHVFAGGLDDFKQVSIFLDPKTAEKIKIMPHKMEFEEICQELPQQCSLELAGEKYFIIQGNYERDDEVDGEDESNAQTSDLAFSLLCRNENKADNASCYAIKVQERKLKGEHTFFCVTGIRPLKNVQAGNFHLVKGELTFQNERKAVFILNHGKLEQLLQEGGSYLNAWQEYTRERGDKALECARKFGKRDYNDSSPQGSTIRLYFDEPMETLVRDNRVQELVIHKMDAPPPLFLNDEESDFLTYCEKKDAEISDIRDEFVCPIEECKENSIVISVSRERKSRWKDSKGRVLTKEHKLKTDDIPPKGYVVMSMRGEEIQIRRQNEAWQNIAQGRAGISHLGNLLEGTDFIRMNRAARSVKITRRVLDKVFPNNPPTDRQKEAIQLALQTPDIALIQGPPGTGKTTVIIAVLELLNEIADKRGNAAGQVWVGAFQHDAVINMIGRIRVNGLPTWKFGKKYTEEKDYTEHIEEWCREVEKRVQGFNPSVQISDSESLFHSYVAEYVYAPSWEYKTRLLEHIHTKLVITEELANRADQLLKDNSNESAKGDDALRKIRALRTTAETFADDGQVRAKELYVLLEDCKYFEGNSDARELLEEVSMGGAPSLQTFQRLQELMARLLEDFSPKPAYISPSVDDDVMELCTDVENHLEERRGSKDKREQIVADWMRDLQTGADAFKTAIQEYDVVYSSSNQQSVGKDITEQKHCNEGYTAPYLYDTVIIDEAARATPPDLLIPMCLASRRILLVGDHRQLPQLVDDDILDVIHSRQEEQEDGGETPPSMTDESAYRLSLFELLFTKLKNLEKKDGIRRIITLDEQYRTHPVLGEFCSRLFYEPHGEGYKSPRPATDFTHALPDIENKAAVWVDVPKALGTEERKGTSRKRECEAECIVEHLLQFAGSEAGKQLSYGIIAFYKAQAELIEKKLKPYTKKLKETTYKVGTVDAFQGMEFDVVFLSIVCTGGNINFLTPNRLCVSMSRQKKVLVAVGCKDFVTSQEACKAEVPALAKFYDLCNEDKDFGKVITWKK